MLVKYLPNRTYPDIFDNLWRRSFERREGYPTSAGSLDDARWLSSEGGYTLKVNVPGYGKEDVTVKVKSGRVYIYVSDSQKHIYSLPKGARVDGITATVDKGVLRVEVPRKADQGLEEIDVPIA